jgi:acyl carrier protein
MDDIPGEVRRGVSKRLDVAEDRVKPDASFIDDLGADSLALVDLTLAFEEMFDIDIPDEEADKIRTVRDAITAVEKCVRASPHALGRAGACTSRRASGWCCDQVPTRELIKRSHVMAATRTTV